MTRQTIVAMVVSIGGTVLFTCLKIGGILGDGAYVGLIAIAALSGIAIAALPRIRELSLGIQGGKMILAEMKEVRDELRKMYGDIDHIKRQPLVLDGQKMEELGHTGGLAGSDAVMRYTAGCIKRERERLAEIFCNPKAPAELAQAVVDHTKDDLVFKWNGPETPLATPPKSVAQRKAEKEAENQK